METLVHEVAPEDGCGGPRRGRTGTAEQTGAFRLAFEALDAWEVKVVGSPRPGSPARDAVRLCFLRQGVRLVMENDTVPEGGRARVLLITDQPGATVIPPGSQRRDFAPRSDPAAGEHAGRGAAAQRGSRAKLLSSGDDGYAGVGHQATQEVRVPAVTRLVNVKLTAESGRSTSPASRRRSV